MTNKKLAPPPAEKLALYDRLLDGRPDIERKGKNLMYTSLNGHMFTYLDPDGVMGLRLPKAEREAFLTEHATVLFEQYGAVMKEYVTVPDALLQDTDALRAYLDISYAYIQSLKPKATTRKKKA